MLKTIFKFNTPDGTITVPADDGKGAAIQSCTLTECVNSGEELTIGSACACSLEATLMLVDGDLSITAGNTVTVYKQPDNDTPTQVGVFVLEKPTRTSANTLKITGYDYVSKLDKDLTAWISGLNGWPYKLTDFAQMVCDACGLSYVGGAAVNADFLVHRFSATSVTGRQIMQWLGEISCSFCRATKNGQIEFAWYTDSGVEVKPTGERYYFQNGFTYENYAVTPVNMVQMTEASSTNMGARTEDTPNIYTIAGNAILAAAVAEGNMVVMTTALDKICEVLSAFVYTPCTVEIPADLNIHAGDMVTITDKNGRQISTCVMTKIQSGQKDTLESTGSPRRDSSTATNNKTQQEKTAAMENYANVAASSAVAGQTAEEILNKLTDNGRIQGIYQQDGKWYINAELAQVVNIVASNIVAGILKSKDEKTFYLDLDKGILKMKAEELSISGKTINEIVQKEAGTAAQEKADEVFEKLTDGGTIQGIYAQDGKWYINAELAKIINLTAEQIDTKNLKVSAANVTDKLSAEQIDATNLKVSAANIEGTLTANSIHVENDAGELLSAGDGAVKIGGWTVASNGLFKSTSDGQIRLIPAANLSREYTVNNHSTSEWVLLCGADDGTVCNLGVSKEGKLYAYGANIRGNIYANGGRIGDWNIGEKTIVSGAATLYSGPALYSDRYYEDKQEVTVTLTPKSVFVEKQDGLEVSVDYASWSEIIRKTNA